MGKKLRIGIADRDHDKQMLRGFTHEISNLVTSNMLILTTTMDSEVHVCHKNAEILENVFDLIESDLPKTKREQVIAYFQQLEANEKKLNNALRILKRSNDRAMDVTHAVSTFSRSGRIPVAKERVQLDQVIEAIVQEQQPVCAELHISLRFTGVVQHALFAHKPHLYLLFTHLVSNACQALAELEDGRERLLEITLTETDRHQTVVIRDTANGIREEHLQEVFEPFYTTSPTTNMGLGLSVVAKLVSLYHGAIDVESETGKGTIVTLTFPLTAAQSA